MWRSDGERNSAEWVRESVIEAVESGRTEICRSGAWLAVRTESGEISVYQYDETIEDE